MVESEHSLMDLKEYKSAIEAILFALAEPVTSEKLAEVLEIDVSTVEKICRSIKDDYNEKEHGICLLLLSDKWQFSTKSIYGNYVKQALDNRRNTPLSSAALEVLAIIAYNQPVTRSFVEQIRGVDSSGVTQLLMQKSLIEEAGRLDLPGRPISFRTTDVFLRTFDISQLAELPAIHKEDDVELNSQDQTTEECENGA